MVVLINREILVVTMSLSYISAGASAAAAAEADNLLLKIDISCELGYAQ